MTVQLVHDETVLIRTNAGQEAVFDGPELGAPHRLLLRLVNGYTPLGGLTARLDPRDNWNAAARELLAHRLVMVQE